eukprot:TRINITY_DN47777_c0_g1_i1.p1 TRINITY_DN47777_c0_g1~~TRINITY_DN47777_c0_g1_i1.p1  ORF type:complete len:1264 (-),score=148.02 TRINITY_DN47777_c0_g1_i1:75-3866(-)
MRAGNRSDHIAFLGALAVLALLAVQIQNRNLANPDDAEQDIQPLWGFEGSDAKTGLGHSFIMKEAKTGVGSLLARRLTNVSNQSDERDSDNADGTKCADNPMWLDPRPHWAQRVGDCKTLNAWPHWLSSYWCFSLGNYSHKVRKACPKACGACNCNELGSTELGRSEGSTKQADAMFYIQVSVNETLNIGLRDSRGFDSITTSKWGSEPCVGTHEIHKQDDPDSYRHVWTNNQSSPKWFYFKVSGFGGDKGDFNISWYKTYPCDHFSNDTACPPSRCKWSQKGCQPLVFHPVANGSCAWAGLDNIGTVEQCKAASIVLKLGDAPGGDYKESTAEHPHGCITVHGKVRFNTKLSSQMCGQGFDCVCKEPACNNGETNCPLSLGEGCSSNIDCAHGLECRGPVEPIKHAHAKDPELRHLSDKTCQRKSCVSFKDESTCPARCQWIANICSPHQYYSVDSCLGICSNSSSGFGTHTQTTQTARQCAAFCHDSSDVFPGFVWDKAGNHRCTCGNRYSCEDSAPVVYKFHGRFDGTGQMDMQQDLFDQLDKMGEGRDLLTADELLPIARLANVDVWHEGLWKDWFNTSLCATIGCTNDTKTGQAVSIHEFDKLLWLLGDPDLSELRQHLSEVKILDELLLGVMVSVMKAETNWMKPHILHETVRKKSLSCLLPRDDENLSTRILQHFMTRKQVIASDDIAKKYKFSSAMMEMCFGKWHRLEEGREYSLLELAVDLTRGQREDNLRLALRKAHQNESVFTDTRVRVSRRLLEFGLLQQPQHVFKDVINKSNAYPEKLRSAFVMQFWREFILGTYQDVYNKLDVDLDEVLSDSKSAFVLADLAEGETLLMVTACKSLPFHRLGFDDLVSVYRVMQISVDHTDKVGQSAIMRSAFCGREDRTGFLADALHEDWTERQRWEWWQWWPVVNMTYTLLTVCGFFTLLFVVAKVREAPSGENVLESVLTDRRLEVLAKLAILFFINLSVIYVPPFWDLLGEKDYFYRAWLVWEVPLWNITPRVISITCVVLCCICFAFMIFDFWEAYQHAKSTKSNDELGGIQPTDRYQSPATSFTDCVLVFVLMTTLMWLFLLYVWTPQRVTLFRKCLWGASVLVQGNIMISVKEMKKTNFFDWACSLLRWTFCMDESGGGPHNKEIWAMHMRAALATGGADYVPVGFPPNNRVEGKRFSWPEIFFRFIFSYASNGLYRALIIYTLPIWLSSNEDISQFVLNAFAITFIVSLDDVPDEHKEGKWKLTECPTLLRRPSLHSQDKV